MLRPSLRWLALPVVSLLALSGCKKETPPPPPPPPPVAQAPAPPPPPSAPFRVTGVQLGRGISPDNRVATATDTFGPKDTIYVSVLSEGMAPKATLTARWTYGPKDVLVKEDTATVTPDSEKERATEFHVAKASGWPVGTYKVTLTADGQPAGEKSFTVAKAGAAATKKR